MSILIKGMEKPKECDDCPLCGYDERESLLFCRLDNEDIVQDLRDDCPLIEIDLVRCGECNRSGTDGENTFCMWLGALRKPTDFCSYGERRENL